MATFGRTPARWKVNGPATVVLTHLCLVAALASLNDPRPLLGAALALGAAFFLRSKTWRQAIPRFSYALVLGLATAVILGLIEPGPVLVRLGSNPWSFTLSLTGAHRGLVLGLRTVCALLAVSLMVDTVGWPGILQALAQLRVPPLLTSLLATTVRYIGLFRGEITRMQRALYCRAFSPASVFHPGAATAFGQLIGASLLRSLDRAERVHRAMLARGYCLGGPLPGQVRVARRSTQGPRMGNTGLEEQPTRAPGEKESSGQDSARPASPPPAIELEDLSFSYPGGPPALKGISFSLEQGARLVVLGPNGAGKSTLLLHLNGLLLPGQGRVHILGREVNRESHRWARTQVGLVFQDPDDQVIAPTVGEDVAFGPAQMGWTAEEIARAASRALGAMGLTELARRPPQDLSLGEKRRAALAGVLAMDPPVVVLDEPTAFLDPATQTELLEVLTDLHLRGKTIVVATHDVDLAAAWADRILLLEGGEVLAYGTVGLLGDLALLERARLRPPWAAALAPAGSDLRRFLEEVATTCTFRTDFWIPRPGQVVQR